MHSPETESLRTNSPEGNIPDDHYDAAKELWNALDRGERPDQKLVDLISASHDAGEKAAETTAVEASGLGLLDTLTTESGDLERSLLDRENEIIGPALLDIEKHEGSDATNWLLTHLDSFAHSHNEINGVHLTGEVSVTPAEKLSLPENIGERINQAIEASSFEPTPEVLEAIKGYYEDHYRLGSLLEKVISNNTEGLHPNDFDKLFENYHMRETAKHLISQEDRANSLLAAQDVLYDDLFTENALGLETVTDTERQYAEKLAEKLRQQAVADGVAVSFKEYGTDTQAYAWKPGLGLPVYLENSRLLGPNNLRIGSEGNAKDFWDDTRFAGQLEFHNTGQFGKISQEGFVLRSRTRQKQLKGSFYSQMGVNARGPAGNMHSNLPHFSESYDYKSYKGQVSGLGNAVETDPVSPATAAVPLAEIISVAPYARDAKYAVLAPKDPVILERVTIKDKIEFIGSQGSDHHGTHGEDRVFMADYRADHVDAAMNYDIEFGFTGKVIMTETEKAAGLVFGHGYGYPSETIIPDVKKLDYVKIRNEHHEMNEDEFSHFFSSLIKEQEVPQVEAIKQLQENSRNKPEYAGKVVVPLRRGVIEFVPEASTDGPRYRRTHRFKQSILHSAAV